MICARQTLLTLAQYVYLVSSIPVYLLACTLGSQTIGNLRNHEGDAEDNDEQKINLYFTYESCDTLKSFNLFLTIKTISKLNLERSVKFGI